MNFGMMILNLKIDFDIEFTYLEMKCCNQIVVLEHMKTVYPSFQNIHF